jgi:hypothetical protein
LALDSKVTVATFRGTRASSSVPLFTPFDVLNASEPFETFGRTSKQSTRAGVRAFDASRGRSIGGAPSERSKILGKFGKRASSAAKTLDADAFSLKITFN